jgi:hypothetical protein
MDFNSLRNYLAKNRHLPGMDSADEIKEKGHIDMTKLTLNSLEKLEELYLYVIELENRVKELEKLTKR